jgi:hypothetical protein
MNFAAVFLKNRKDAGRARYARRLSRGAFLLFALFLLCPALAARGEATTLNETWNAADEYYTISDATQFRTFRDWVNEGKSADCTYRLAADIDLQNDNWLPIGAILSDDWYFTGVLSGDGHNVSNFRIVGTDYVYEFAGLFGILSGDARISGLGVTDFRIDVGRGKGDLGDAIDFAKAIINGAAPTLLPALDTVLESDLFKDLNLSSDSLVRTLIKDLFVGGLAGGVGGTASVKNCSAAGDLSVKVTAIPLDGTLDPSLVLALGTLAPAITSGASFALAGGLVGGQAGGSIEAVSADVRVSGSISGDEDLTIALVGGLIGGQMGGKLTNGYAAGAVSASKGAEKPIAVAGGFIGGQVGGSVANAFAAGSVSGTGTGTQSRIIGGGFAGAASAAFEYHETLTESINIDLVLGGAASIENAYAVGPVSVPEDGGLFTAAGGFVGYRISEEGSSAGTIENGYAAGRVDGPASDAGGFIGYNNSGASAEVTGCEFDTQGTGQTKSTGAGRAEAIVSRTNEEMTGGDAPSGSGWSAASGYYPELTALAGVFPEASDFFAVPVLFGGGTDTSRNVSQTVRVPIKTHKGAEVSFDLPAGLTVGSDGVHWLLTPAASGEAELKVRTGTGANAPAKTFRLKLSAGDIQLSKSGTQRIPGQPEGYDASRLGLDVEVSNVSGRPVNGLKARLSGADADKFEFSTASFDAYPVDLAADGSDSFRVGPKAGLSAKTYTATVTVSNGSGVSKGFDMEFQVTAKPADSYSIALDPSGPHSFPSLPAGYTPPAPLEVNVWNNGGRSVDSLNITLSGSGGNAFFLSKASLDEIPVNGIAGFSVVPKAGLHAGTYSARVTVYNDKLNLSGSLDVSFKVNSKPASYDGGGGGCSAGAGISDVFGMFGGLPLLLAALPFRRKPRRNS